MYIIYKVIFYFVAFIIYYIYLSFVDWFIHSFIMHNPNTFFLELRESHKKHHINNNYSITFDYYETLIIYLFSLFFILLIYVFYKYFTYNNISIKTIAFIALFNAISILLGVASHNYCHSKHHNCLHNIGDCFIIKVPNYICNIINNHHEKHHYNSKTNFCTIFLGFDYIANTNYNT
jgi:hypothetical protein